MGQQCSCNCTDAEQELYLDKDLKMARQKKKQAKD
jgi:hypothetical protein